MKILFAGCKKEFLQFQKAYARNSCMLNEFKDGSQLIQEGRLVAEGYDWVILNGRDLTGERDLAHFSENGTSLLIEHHCGVTVTDAGVLKFTCGLHQRSGMRDTLDGADDVTPNGFVFEYQSKCTPR